MEEKNGAAYCRVSTVLECQEDSLGWQKQHYTKMLSESKNIRFVGVYSDDHSGRSIHDRPGFQKMLEDCETGKIDVIYTKSISRFSRNIVDCATVVRHLKDLGISVFFEKEGINSGDDQCEMLFNRASRDDIERLDQTKHKRSIPVENAFQGCDKRRDGYCPARAV